MKKTVLTSLKIKDNLQKFNKIDFWCDYLTLSYTESIWKFNELLFWVDNDNSCFWVTEIFWHDVTYDRQVTPLWLWLNFFIEYNWIPIKIFQYVKFNKQNRELLWKSAKICVYWAYFRLESIWVFEYRSIINYISSLSVEDPVITRYDYRIDYFSRSVQVSGFQTRQSINFHQDFRIVIEDWLWIYHKTSVICGTLTWTEREK